jgi:hypothetical protein
MVLTLGKLYEEGKFYREFVLRFWDAIALEFYGLIREQGFAVIDYTEAGFEEEVRRGRHLGEKLVGL